jgi:hypothetical protein
MRMLWLLLLSALTAAAAATSLAQSTKSRVTSERDGYGKSGKTNSAANVEPSTGAKSAKPKSSGAKVLPGITPEREAAVMTFVKHHHAELAELLIHLKENAPKEYERAVRDLFRTSERLAQVQERDSLAYDLELKIWKARSRAQLLAARLQMGDNEELRKQLKATLNEEYDFRLELLERDHERASDRAKSLGDQLEKFKQRRDDEIEKQLKQLTSAARGGEAKPKATPKKKSGK